MKKYIFILAFFAITTELNAQKHDYNWVSGYSGSPDTSDPIGITILKFNETTKLDFSKISFLKKIYLESGTSAISDKAGNLVMYTDGEHIINYKHDTLARKLSRKSDIGIVMPQGTLILPFPEKDSLYMTFYQSSGFLPGTNIFAIQRFSYAIVDMKMNNGAGKVTIRDQSLHTFIPTYGKLAACKHADGKNWWILVNEFETNKFHRFLLNKDGIKKVGEQEVGLKLFDGVGTAVFSPNGKKYAIYQGVDGFNEVLSTYDFDRCTGLLSNQKQTNFTGKYDAAGVAISPNSRYLYLALGDELRQYDLEKADLKKSEKVAAKWDGFKNPIGNTPVGFHLGQLAPNGKIYYCAAGGSRFLHVIEKPDLPDTLCQVKQHSIELPTYYSSTLCSFPNFRIGATTTPCNSVASEDIVQEEVNVKLYPNPSQDFFTLDKGLSIANSIAIYDINGRFISSQSIENQTTIINVTYLKSGIYYCRLLNDSEPISLLKFTIIR